MTTKETRGKGQKIMAKRLLDALSNKEITKAKEAIEVLGGLMKDAAGPSTGTSLPGPSADASQPGPSASIHIST